MIFEKYEKLLEEYFKEDAYEIVKEFVVKFYVMLTSDKAFNPEERRLIYNALNRTSCSLYKKNIMEEIMSPEESHLPNTLYKATARIARTLAPLGVVQVDRGDISNTDMVTFTIFFGGDHGNYKYDYSIPHGIANSRIRGISLEEHIVNAVTTYVQEKEKAEREATRIAKEEEGKKKTQKKSKAAQAEEVLDAVQTAITKKTGRGCGYHLDLRTLKFTMEITIKGRSVTYSDTFDNVLDQAVKAGKTPVEYLYDAIVEKYNLNKSQSTYKPSTLEQVLREVELVETRVELLKVLVGELRKLPFVKEFDYAGLTRESNRDIYFKFSAVLNNSSEEVTFPVNVTRCAETALICNRSLRAAIQQNLENLLVDKYNENVRKVKQTTADTASSSCNNCGKCSSKSDKKDKKDKKESN